MNLDESGCMDGRWMEQAQDFAQYRESISGVESSGPTTRKLVTSV